jgi:hypothetical protein
MLDSCATGVFMHALYLGGVRLQKTPLRVDVNVYHATQRLSVDAAQQNGRSVCCTALGHRSKMSSVEIYVSATMCLERGGSRGWSLRRQNDATK